jgi:hypothetical protein
LLLVVLDLPEPRVDRLVDGLLFVGVPGVGADVYPAAFVAHDSDDVDGYV